MKMKTIGVLLLLVFTTYSLVGADGTKPQKPSDEVQKQIDTYMENLKSTVEQTNSQIQADEKLLEKIEKIQQRLDGREFQDKLQDMRKQIAEQFDLEIEPQTPADTDKNRLRLKDSERLLVFISSSMPTNLLRSYARELSELNDPNVMFVMRGFIGGVQKVKPTLGFIQSILAKDTSCSMKLEQGCELYQVEVIVDPLLFRKYGINKVPTVVFADGLNIVNPEMSVGDDENLKSAGDVIGASGSASLLYTMEKMQDKCSKKSIARIISNLKDRGFYGGK